MTDFEKEAKKVLEGTAWSVSWCEEKDGLYDVIIVPEDCDVEEDFFLKFAVRTAEELVDCIRRYAEGFDPEEHAEMWVRARYTNPDSGIPGIRTLIAEADREAESLSRLAESLG